MVASAFPVVEELAARARSRRDRILTQAGRLTGGRSKAQTARYVLELAARVEPYQPLWGLPAAPAERVSRGCADRLAAILDHAQLPTWKGQHLVDLGSSLGWFSLEFRSRGAVVDAVEVNPTLVAICRQLALMSDLRSDITFHNLRLQDYVRHIMPRRQQNVALALSVLHHVAHDLGFDNARAVVREIVRNTELSYFEMAVREEQVTFPWVESLPQCAADWFALAADDGAQVALLGHFPTHLSGTKRPLYALRQTRLWVNGKPYGFERWTTAAYSGADRPGRRFYFGDRHVVKRLDFAPGDQHQTELAAQSSLRDQIVREVGVLLMLRDCGIPSMVRMVDWEITPQHGTIVFDRAQGQLLSERMGDMDTRSLRHAVVDVIRCVQALKTHGIHHNDIRLHNLMVDDSGRATVIDFGLAGPVETESTKAALLHLIRAVATRSGMPAEYPLRPPAAAGGALPAWIEDVHGFVESGRIDAIPVDAL